MILRLFLLASVAVFSLCLSPAGAGDKPLAAAREAARKQMEAGNYKDAAGAYRELILDSRNSPKDVVDDLYVANMCLESLELAEERAKLLEAAETAWSDSWRVLLEVAVHHRTLPHLVQPLDGGFQRVLYWGGNGWNTEERDRVAALRLMLRAEGLLDSSADAAEPADRECFYRRFASLLMWGRENAAWRLTALTDLETLPEYEGYAVFYRKDERGAPVDADGNPLYYSIPESWDAAANDGERWRWLLGRLAAANGEESRAVADWLLAEFLQRQFGVHTMGRGFPVPGEFEAGTGAFAVRTLGENETIARLATGVKRFAMPDEFNFIAIYRRLSDRTSGPYASQATAALARLFENRQQYHKAVSFWERITQKFAANAESHDATRALARITGLNGRLEAGPVAPAGRAVKVPYLFRNGKRVAMTAYRLDDRKLMADVRQMLKNDSSIGQRFNVRNIEGLGRVVVEEGRDEYIAETTARWTVDLEPLPDYYSTRKQIELPFTAAGCYLVEAIMESGNISRVVVWLADLALVRKPVANYQVVYVTDAVTGEPAAGANVSFFGYRFQHHQDSNRTDVLTKEFAETTDENGLIVVESDQVEHMEWLIAARTADDRLAYYGFTQVWSFGNGEPPPDQVSAFIITDRPAYRPDQTVNFKLWLGQPRYDGKSDSFAGQSVMVKAHNPMGEIVYEKSLTVDAYGGAADQLVLGAKSPLGDYSLYTEFPGHGQNGWTRFRLEEYKKPEYEVTVETPGKALLLGDSTEITVKAAYYYGSPVTDATVKYKVLRSPRRSEWFPPWRWDWLYGSGRWWASYDYAWYPGWSDWGMPAPAPFWRGPFSSQPELVAEGEGTLGADGVFRLPLDTAPARDLFGDRDHEYAITAEVTDRSRRAIVGEGRVVAARKPFAVAVWADRGYHLAGQEIAARVNARLPLGGGVEARGRAVLYRVKYDPAGVPSETEAQSWEVATDASGSAELRLKADRPGQYRLSCLLADADGNRVEGAAVLAVRGEGTDGDFRFNDLELVPDRRDYRPGDTVRLAVNSSNKKAVVLLFPRAERFGGKKAAKGEQPEKPALLRLENGTRIVDLEVGLADQPNFFCEALTIYEGRTYTEAREIFVPPADKTLNVEVTADQPSYPPGGKAAFAVAVTDADGKPVAGQLTVSLYDRAVEYISGGSNVGDIRSHFWSWKRQHNFQCFSSLRKYGYRVMKKDDVQWEPLGMFGPQEADWNDDMVYTNGGMLNTFETRSLFAGGNVDRLYAPRPPSPAMTSPSAVYKSEAEFDLAGSDGRVAVTRMQANFQVPVPGETGGGQAMAEARVRSEFADTALWIAALDTDENGRATFTADLPENLTAWKARTWAMAGGTRVGDGDAAVETRKNVVIRPQAPRFLTQKDRVVLSANLHNYLPRAKSARAELTLEGGVLEPAEGVELVKQVELAGGGEARVDWLVDARRPGEARIVMKLLTDEESDAAEITLPVVVHGARRVENFGGVVRGDETETTIRFTVPAERLPDQSRLELAFSPSIASAMLEALPFLVDYPYGCTEQTLNRFLPAVMARKHLDAMGIPLAAAGRVPAGPGKDAKSAEWRERFGDPRSQWRKTPVFDDDELAAMVKQGIERLNTMQNADGGWGWFSGTGEKSWPHTTAVVMHGLLAAADNGVAVPDMVRTQGLDWLRAYRNRQIDLLKQYLETDGKEGKARADNLDAFVNMVLAGRQYYSPEMRDFLYRDRLSLSLSLSGLSMLGIALHDEGATNFLELVLQNLGQYVEENREIGTAWLRTPERGWWWWYNDRVETQAWYLKLLARVDPAGSRASGVAKHLLRNRRNGSYWQSTRDTAYAIEALAEYAKESGEVAPDMTVTVFLDGRQVLERRLTAANALDDNRLLLEGLAVEAGEHELRVVKSGRGNVYYSGALDVFGLEDPIAGAGLELKVDRAYYRLVREEATAIAPTASGVAASIQVEKYRRERMPTPFAADAPAVALSPGDLVEVELTIEAANEYEYLIFEDMKAAGCEAVEVRSGYTGNQLGAYVEYRDQKVVLFVRHLPQGRHTISYRLRAEVPGWFSALPTFAGGMYAADLFANSDEMRVRIVETGVFE